MFANTAMVWSNQSISVFSLFPRNYWNTPTFTDTVPYCNYQKEKQNTSLLELAGSSSLEVFWGQVKPFLAVCYFYLDKHLRHMRVRRYRCRQQVKIPHLEVDDSITPLMCAHVCMAQPRWLTEVRKHPENKEFWFLCLSHWTQSCRLLVLPSAGRNLALSTQQPVSSIRWRILLPRMVVRALGWTTQSLFG